MSIADDIADLGAFDDYFYGDGDRAKARLFYALEAILNEATAFGGQPSVKSVIEALLSYLKPEYLK